MGIIWASPTVLGVANILVIDGEGYLPCFDDIFKIILECDTWERMGSLIDGVEPDLDKALAHIMQVEAEAKKMSLGQDIEEPQALPVAPEAS